jgi:hypothetical protein
VNIPGLIPHAPLPHFPAFFLSFFGELWQGLSKQYKGGINRKGKGKHLLLTMQDMGVKKTQHGSSYLWVSVLSELGHSVLNFHLDTCSCHLATPNH